MLGVRQLPPLPGSSPVTELVPHGTLSLVNTERGSGRSDEVELPVGLTFLVRTPHPMMPASEAFGNVLDLLFSFLSPPRLYVMTAHSVLFSAETQLHLPLAGLFRLSEPSSPS